MLSTPKQYSFKGPRHTQRLTPHAADLQNELQKISLRLLFRCLGCLTFEMQDAKMKSF